MENGARSLIMISMHMGWRSLFVIFFNSSLAHTVFSSFVVWNHRCELSHKVSSFDTSSRRRRQTPSEYDNFFLKPPLAPASLLISHPSTPTQLQARNPASLADLLPFPVPPWRGTRQLLHIGPWGVLIDRLLSVENGGWGLRKPNPVLYIVDDNNFNAYEGLADSNKKNEDEVNFSVFTEPTLYHDPTQVPPRHVPSSNSQLKQQTVRICFISDTHGKHYSLSIPNGDILIHCGDILLRYGYPYESGGGGNVQKDVGLGGVGYEALNDFDDWLGTLPHSYKFVVGGNHDDVLDRREQRGANDGCGWTPKNAFLLNGSLFSVPLPISDQTPRQQPQGLNSSSINIFGTPHSPQGVTLCDAFQNTEVGQMAFQNALTELSAEISTHTPEKSNISPTSLQGGIDILVTHARNNLFDPIVFPSKSDLVKDTHSTGNSLNNSSKDASTGSKKRPRIWAYGHFHDDHGIRREFDNMESLDNGSKFSNSCLCINAAVCDMIYRPVQPIIVVDYVVSY